MRRRRAAGDAAGPAPATAASAAAAASGDAYLPSRIALEAEALRAGGKLLTHVVAGATQRDGGWSANVTADQLDGHLDWQPAPGGGAGRVVARLARLDLPKDEPPAAGAPPAAASAGGPTSLPALDVHVDALAIGGRPFGQLDLEAANRDGGWQLSRVRLATPEALLAATGRWDGGAPGRRGGTAAPPSYTRLDFQLDILDAGGLLARLGSPGAVAGGRGRASGRLEWPGSPTTPRAPVLRGGFSLEVEAGRFLKAEPGAARLLSVLSLQSLRHRLSLDFRDVFEQGFAFDSFTGDVKIAGGVASSNNLRMRGLQAAVLMDGSADLARETQDLRVVVVPEINAGTASLAFAVINPAIGLGTFLAQLVLRQPLIAAGTREFRVTGSWDEPKIDRVERRTAVPDAAAAEPASAAASAAPPTPAASTPSPLRPLARLRGWLAPASRPAASAPAGSGGNASTIAP